MTAPAPFERVVGLLTNGDAPAALERLLTDSFRLPYGTVYETAHHPRCRCANDASAPLSSCVCDRIDVTLRSVPVTH